MNIYIVTSSETEYDDNYYDLNPYATTGNIDFVHINLDLAVTYAKKRIIELYDAYVNDLDSIEWNSYTIKSRYDLTNTEKLDLLKEITHNSIKIHVYKCELNDKDEAVFKLDKRLVINPDTQEPETLHKRKWW